MKLCIIATCLALGCGGGAAASEVDVMTGTTSSLLLETSSIVEGDIFEYRWQHQPQLAWSERNPKSKRWASVELEESWSIDTPAARTRDLHKRFGPKPNLWLVHDF